MEVLYIPIAVTVILYHRIIIAKKKTQTHRTKRNILFCEPRLLA